MIDYDLVVVGAGPAGAVAACSAAQHGLSVLIVEQKKEVGYPSHCAGGILTAVLENMQLKPVVKDAIKVEIKNVQMTSPSGFSTLLEFTRTIGYVIDRPAFDQRLVQLAQKHGAELQTQTKAIGLNKTESNYNELVLKHKNETRSVFTRIIIGADGIASNVAKWTGLKIPQKYAGIGFGHNAEKITNIEPDTVEIYFLGALPGGYAWIFPQGPHSANIGVGGYNTGTYMQKIFNWARTQHPTFSTKVLNADLKQYTGGILPGSKLPRKTTFNYGMIIGDACNHLDPLTGEGIRLSLICGDLSGKIAAWAIKSGNLNHVHRYHKLMQKRIGLEFYLGYFLRHFLLRSTAEDYDRFIRAISKIDLNPVFNKKKWLPIFIRGCLKTPSVLKLIRSGFHSLPSHVKTFFNYERSQL